MFQPYPEETEKLMREVYQFLPERSRRLYAGIEALKLSHGGISYIARIFDCTRDTVMRGIKEVKKPRRIAANRERAAGGGRKTVLEMQPEIEAAFLLILKEHTAGDPMDEKIKWTDLTQGRIVDLLAEKGFKVSDYIVAKLLKKHGFVKRKALKKSLPEHTKTAMLSLKTLPN